MVLLTTSVRTRGMVGRMSMFVRNVLIMVVGANWGNSYSLVFVITFVTTTEARLNIRATGSMLRTRLLGATLCTWVDA